MPYTRKALLDAVRTDHPEFKDVPDDKLFAAIAVDHPDLVKGISELQPKPPVGRVSRDYSPSEVATSHARELALGVVEGVGIDPAAPVTSALKGLWNLGRDVTMASILPGSTEESKRARASLRRMIIDPSIEEFRKARDYYNSSEHLTPTSAAGAAVHALAGAVPFVGPLAANVGSEIRTGLETGDSETVAHGVGRGTGLVGSLAAGTKEGQAVIGKAGQIIQKPVTKVANAITAGAGAAAKIPAEVLGVATGVGSDPIKTAFRSPTQPLMDAMRGEITEAEIVKGFQDAVQKVADKRSAEYQAKLANLGDVDLSTQLADLQAHARAELAKFGVKRKNGELDFSRSTIHDAGEQAKVQKLINDLDDWGYQPGDTTPLGMDLLKRRISDFFSDSGQARALVQSVRSKLAQSLKADVPGYAEMTKGYATASEFIKQIQKEFSIGPNANMGTAIRKISGALKANNEYRTLLTDALDAEAGSTLKQQLAGNRLSSLSPRGLAATAAGLEGAGMLMGVLSGTIPATALGGLLASSPRLVGELVTLLGRTMKHGSLPEDVAQTIARAAEAAAPAASTAARATAEEAATTTPIATEAGAAAAPPPPAPATAPPPIGQGPGSMGGPGLPPPSATPRWSNQAMPLKTVNAPEPPPAEPTTLRDVIDMPEWAQSRYKKPASLAQLGAAVREAGGPAATEIQTLADQMAAEFIDLTDSARQKAGLGEGGASQIESEGMNYAGKEMLETMESDKAKASFKGYNIKSSSPVAHFTETADQIYNALSKGKGKLYDRIMVEFRDAARRRLESAVPVSPGKAEFAKWRQKNAPKE